jgi:hypothetical protein
LVEKLGKQSGNKWRLASLNGDRIVIEDTASHSYLLAEHKKAKRGRYEITNITPIVVIEGKKKSLFEQNVTSLIDSIEENDQAGMTKAWKGLKSQRFSSTVIPESGLVKTRDGVSRHVSVHVDRIIDEHTKSKLIKALLEASQDHIMLENNRVVGASFRSEKLKIPISEWTSRKVVGNHMREAAKDAQHSEGFQKRIYKLAQLVEKDRLNEATQLVAPFLKETQEFAMLMRNEVQTLVENSLAANAVLNQSLCDNVTKLFHRVNLKINRGDIVQEWRNVAQAAQHPILLENVNKLDNAKDFETAYDQFLNMTFNEALSQRDEEIEAYRTTLEMMRNLPSIKEDIDLRSKIDELINRLNEENVDDATVHVVRETLAAAKKELSMLEGLDDFDALPGADEEDLGDDLSDTLGGEVDAATPTIEINAPLIQIGGEDMSGGLGGEDLGGDDLDLGGGEDDDLGLGGGEEDDLGGLTTIDREEEEDELGDLAGLGLESRNRSGKLVESAVRKALGLSENARIDNNLSSLISQLKSKADELSPTGRSMRRAIKESECCKKCDCDPCSCDGDDDNDSGKPWEESVDPYAFDKISIEPGLGKTYGLPVLSSDDMVDIMAHAKNVHNEGTANGTVGIAREAIKRSGIRVPKHQVDEAIYDISEKIQEDQYKWSSDALEKGDATNAMDRSSIRDDEDDNSGSNKGEGEDNLAPLGESFNIVEADPEGKGIMFEHKGVKVVLDYADPQILTSIDETVQIPVPTNLQENALAAARVIPGNPQPFITWVGRGIEQFRTATSKQDHDLNEAIAQITTGPDGSIDVKIDSDDPGVEVHGIDGMDGESGMPVDEPIDGELPPEGGELPPEGGEDDMMEPVVDLDPEGGELDDEVGDDVPDFEGGEEESPEVGADEMDFEDEEEPEPGIGEGVVGEDNDITEPKKKPYNTADDNLRDWSKQAEKSVPKGNGDKLDGFDEKEDKSIKKDNGDLKPAKPGKNTQ